MRPLLIWAVGFDLAVVIACKWIGSRGLPSKRRRRDTGSGRLAGELAGAGDTGPPSHQILWEGHREEEKKVGKFTWGSDGREERRERRSWQRLRRTGGAPVAAALQKWGKEEEWRGL
jgi:hypothetical protein